METEFELKKAFWDTNAWVIFFWHRRSVLLIAKQSKQANDNFNNFRIPTTIAPHATKKLLRSSENVWTSRIVPIPEIYICIRRISNPGSLGLSTPQTNPGAKLQYLLWIAGLFIPGMCLNKVLISVSWSSLFLLLRVIYTVDFAHLFRVEPPMLQGTAVRKILNSNCLSSHGKTFY